MSEPDQFSKNLEALLRWIFDKPLNVRPPIGHPPSFILNPDTPAIGTVMIGKRVIEGLKNDSAYTKGAFDEFLTTFGTNIERFRIVSKDGNFDDHVVQSIEDFTPSRNDFIQVMTATIQYGDPLDHIERIHRFFESLIRYLFRPTELLQWTETDFDNFRFIIHELFLYTMTLLIRAEKFNAATYLLEQVYYREDSESRGENPTTNFTIFREHMKSLEIRNQRLGSHRLSLRADLLEQRSKISGIPFRLVMQTDFICFMRAELLITEEHHRWWPETLLYTNRIYGPFEVFARSISKKYLAKILMLLGVPDLATVKAKLDEYQSGTVRLPQWQFDSIHPRALMGFDKLGTLP